MNEIKNRPESFERFVVTRYSLGNYYYVDSFDSIAEAEQRANEVDYGDVWDANEEDEPLDENDYYDECGFDPYEGCYTYDC